MAKQFIFFGRGHGGPPTIRRAGTVHDLGKEQYLLAYPEALADDDCNMQ